MKKQLLIVSTCMILTAMTTACGATDSKDKAATSTGGKTVVTVSLRTIEAFYDAAEKKFEEKHPNIDIQLKTYNQPGEKGNEGDEDKYVTTTNTSLLAGKGADLIEMTHLPVGKYVDKKLLVNMNDLLEQDKSIDKNNIYSKILKSVQVNNGLYVMPVSYYLRAFVGNEDILTKTNTKIDDTKWTWKQFEEISRKLLQHSAKDSKGPRYGLAGNPPEIMLNVIVEDNSTQFIDIATRKAKFDSPSFVETMKQIKKMYDEQIMTAKEPEVGKQLFNDTTFFNPIDFIETTHYSIVNPKLMQKPHAEGNSGQITMWTGYQLGLNAKSTVQKEAWQFMSFLLSEEAQSLKQFTGFSMLKSVNEKKLNDIQEQLKNGTYKVPIAGSDTKFAKIPDADFTYIKQLIDNVDRIKGSDEKVWSIIEDESKSYFSGHKTAEEVAKLIQNRVNLYLNE